MHEYLGELTLDLDCRKTMPVIQAGQYDKGRKYLIHIMANGIVFPALECTVIVQGIRNNKSHFADTCAVDSDGNVILNLSDEILSVSGFIYAKLVLSDSSKNYSTQVFIIDVDGSYEGDIITENSYSIVNDFMNKLMLLFGLDSPSDMLRRYPYIEVITAAEVDYAVDNLIFYRVSLEGRTNLMFCVNSGSNLRTQYRFDTFGYAKYRTQQNNGGEWEAWSNWKSLADNINIQDLAVDTSKIANEAVTTEKIAKGSITRDKFAPDIRFGDGAGIPVIDDKTSAGWDGTVPTIYAGELGSVVFYDGYLWLLYGISNLNGTTYYNWERIPDAAELELAMQGKENMSNKTSTITEDNKDSTTLYTTPKAVADYVASYIEATIGGIENGSY